MRIYKSRCITPTLKSQASGVEYQRSLQLGAAILVLGYITFTCGARLGVLGLVLAGVAIAGTACYGFTYVGGFVAALWFQLNPHEPVQDQ